MQDSISQARIHSGPLELPAWKTILSTLAAVVLGFLFIVSGVWKLVEPFEWTARVVQAKVPAFLGTPAALFFGITETFAGVMLMVPRFRRWGAWLSGFLLLGFMAWFGYYYEELTGADCSCFPWLKRTVGPGFFIGDAVMLAMAAVAGIWSRRTESLRSAAVILGAITVFAFVSLGMNHVRQSGSPAPEEITVAGQPYSLATGRHFLYFFDPECSHCYEAAKAMSQYRWNDVAVIGVPTVNPQFAPGFLQETGLNAKLSSDLTKLKTAFPFENGPFAVAVEDGRQKASLNIFEGNEPEQSLRKLGFVD